MFSFWFEKFYYSFNFEFRGYNFGVAFHLHSFYPGRCQFLVLTADAPDGRQLIFDCDWGWGYYASDGKVIV